MTIFNKPLTDPELLAALKKDGKLVLEVTIKRYYVLHASEQPVEEVVRDWFVKWNGRSHAYRDGSHVGGADQAISAKDLTNDKDVPIRPITAYEEVQAKADEEAFEKVNQVLAQCGYTPKQSS